MLFKRFGISVVLLIVTYIVVIVLLFVKVYVRSIKRINYLI